MDKQRPCYDCTSSQLQRCHKPRVLYCWIRQSIIFCVAGGDGEKKDGEEEEEEHEDEEDEEDHSEYEEVTEHTEGHTEHSHEEGEEAHEGEEAELGPDGLPK